MNEDIIAQLKTHSELLYNRAPALNHPDQDRDLWLVMESLAITMEAVRTLGVAVNRLDGLEGFGGPGA
ncbi:hypothetical protein P6U16_08705 [Rhizobium sp. 32-5/1]|uniref:hypothetical protein n=1 Tax=Rhizobium sp. 32-5/1 TaxID=3019602 RepID=UPI00240DBE52|nr:hypothetical protein [Rhizobium sp. 32-5/1]WEZ84635.1 hypothetical protein P6U16_08705 [Rhizobium sp. 32-5/1]